LLIVWRHIVGIGIKTLDVTLKIVSDIFDGAGPLEWILNMICKGRAGHNKELEFCDEVRRSLLKVALVDTVAPEAYRSERREPDMLAICIPPIFLNKECLEDFRIMCINDVTVGLFEVANKKLKHPHLHFEPQVRSHPVWCCIEVGTRHCPS
jgi:hypothetical protein